jgi:hypothetical protein
VPTLTPGFREFLPSWIARQPWYSGPASPALRPVGFIRYEDPAGEVGMETHLLTDGGTTYQVPLTYRGSPLPDGTAALLAITEHSELGTRWIYDAETDPVWIATVLRLVRSELTPQTATIQLNRVLTADPRPSVSPPGFLMGSWRPDGPDSAEVRGYLVVIRAKASSD